MKTQNYGMWAGLVSDRNEVGNQHAADCSFTTPTQDALGKTSCYRYDIRSRKVAEFGTALQPALYAYDDADNLVALTTFRVDDATLSTDPADRTDGDTTQWAYNAATGLEMSKTYPDSTQVLKTYDAMNRIATVTNARGTVQTRTYATVIGLLTGITFSDSTTPQTFAHNVLGQLTQVKDAAGTRTFTYIFLMMLFLCGGCMAGEREPAKAEEALLVIPEYDGHGEFLYPAAGTGFCGMTCEEMEGEEDVGYLIDIPNGVATLEYRGIIKGGDIPQYGIARHKKGTQQEIENDRFYVCLMFTNTTQDFGLYLKTEDIEAYLVPFERFVKGRFCVNNGILTCHSWELSPGESLMLYVPIENAGQDSCFVYVEGKFGISGTYISNEGSDNFPRYEINRQPGYDRIYFESDYLPLFPCESIQDVTTKGVDVSFLLTGLGDLNDIWRYFDEHDKNLPAGIVVFYENNTDHIVETDVLVGDSPLYSDYEFFLEYDILLRLDGMEQEAFLRFDMNGTDYRHRLVLMPGEKWKVPLAIPLERKPAVQFSSSRGFGIQQGFSVDFVEKADIIIDTRETKSTFKGTAQAIRFWDSIRWWDEYKIWLFEKERDINHRKWPWNLDQEKMMRASGTFR